MRVNRVLKASQRAVDLGFRCSRCHKLIEKGQPYQWAKGRYTSKRIHCGDCPFRPSELTGSDKLQRLYEAQESLQDAVAEWQPDGNDCDHTTIVSAIEEAVSQAEEVAQEYRDAAEAMGAAGGENEEKADMIDSWVSELQDVDVPEFDFDEALRQAIEEHSTADFTPEEDDEAVQDAINDKIDDWAEGIKEEVNTAAGALEM